MAHDAAGAGPEFEEECAREPIRVPGRVQPHGALLGLDPTTLTVRQASANAAGWLGVDDDEPLVGRPADALFDAASIEAITSAFTHRPLDEATTLLSLAAAGRPVDSVVHVSEGLLVLELLRPQGGPRPLTFTDAYRRAQARMAPLHETAGYQELLDRAAEQVQVLTGFDRVMIYRFDEDYNGEVVAETHRDGLEPFLGLHYPASDIPAQARALYESNWIRLIADVDAPPVALEPADNPLSGGPTDLSLAWLRAVSPVHIEYLRNMGVRASMSVSVLRDGRLWGLIACHHYSGPLEPAYEVCVTAELLGQVLSARLVDAAERERELQVADKRGVLTALVAAVGGDASLAEALTSGELTCADLVDCDGVVVRLEGEVVKLGRVPDDATLAALPTDRAVFATDRLHELAPDADPDIAGVLAVDLGEEGRIVWARGGRTEHVTWGGDPNEKSVIRTPDGQERLGPRRSFAAWQETVADQSLPWSTADVALASQLRGHVLAALYARTRRMAQAALSLQLSLLPASLPQIPGYELGARYMPAAEDAVGGDWYDVLQLPSGCVALVVGDVSGHGMAAAGQMGQLRSAMRAYALTEDGPIEIIARVRELCDQLLPVSFATCVVATLDPSDGQMRLATAGHPPPILTTAAGSRALPVRPLPPLGAPARGAADDETALRLEPGDRLLLYTDGLIERRGEALTSGIDRLSTRSGVGSVEQIVAEHRPVDSGDDATVLSVQRDVAA